MSFGEIVDKMLDRNVECRYVRSSKIGPFEIPAKGEVDLPNPGYIYKYPRIIVTNFAAGFDSILCGIRIRTEPEYDSEDNLIVLNAAIGFSDSDPAFYAKIPPHTPPGIFIFRCPTVIPGLEWMRLSVINTDTVPHMCFAFGCTLFGMKGNKKETT